MAFNMDENGAVDDLDAFLNLGESDFNLPLFDPSAVTNAQDYDHMHQGQTAHPHQQDGFQAMQQHHGYDPNVHHQQHMPPQPQHLGPFGAINYSPMDADAMSAAPSYPHLQKTMSTGSNYQQAISGAPPTPHSGEMHAKPAPYQQPRGHHQYAHRQGDPNAFTPFLSPELDGSASVMSHAQGYTTPGMYNLSPLTSPAMGPQQGLDARTPRSHPMTASGSLVGSPNDTNAGRDGMEDAEDIERPRKTRKTATAPRKVATSNASRQRKTPTSTPRMRGSLNLKIPEQGGSSNGSSDSPFDIDPRDATRGNASASSSISPRPLQEAVMAPPPKPNTPHTATANGTPQHQGQPQPAPTPTQQSPSLAQAGRPLAAPATPASMMKLKSPAHAGVPGSGSGSVDPGEQQSPALEASMEYLKLPEAATGPVQSDETSANPRLAPLPKLKTKTSVGESNPSDSPRTSAVASPAGPQGTSKSDAKGARQSKKRNSSSSNLVSPALRPKVSPSVKPLLPEGTPIDSQTHALLLASRSNYENILSGSHLPGVSYPADLSANLTSKRTSHKIAEQGRRNRINLALQEMQTLLPASFTSAASPPSKPSDAVDKNGGSGSKTPSTPTQGGSSKAATVESAIDYIKHLQQDTSLKDAAIERMKQEIDSLRLRAGDSSASE